MGRPRPAPAWPRIVCRRTLVYNGASVGYMFLERATEGFPTPNDYGCSHRDFSGVEFFFKVLLCSKFSKKKKKSESFLQSPEEMYFKN